MSGKVETIRRTKSVAMLLERVKARAEAFFCPPPPPSTQSVVYAGAVFCAAPDALVAGRPRGVLIPFSIFSTMKLRRNALSISAGKQGKSKYTHKKEKKQ